MKTCWLCREPIADTDILEQVGADLSRCPSCNVVLVHSDGSKPFRAAVGLNNSNIALARAVDRLTRQLVKNEEDEKLARIARKLGFP
jgi:hypothetical protein